jgi:hypothetical protein
MPERKVGTQQEFNAAREELLAEEKELTRRGDGLARKRRELPWVPVEKDYSFETEAGTKSLRELFDGRSQPRPAAPPGHAARAGVVLTAVRVPRSRWNTGRQARWSGFATVGGSMPFTHPFALPGDLGEPVPGRRRCAGRRRDQLGDGRVNN